jgi:hypothetical protein
MWSRGFLLKVKFYDYLRGRSLWRAGFVPDNMHFSGVVWPEKISSQLTFPGGDA